MPKCTKCNGSGYVPKHKNCSHTTYEAYIEGCNDTIQCRKCHGFGVLGAEFVRGVLLEISINSSDNKARKWATQALDEWNEIKEKEN
jgi:hypothetical protein